MNNVIPNRLVTESAEVIAFETLIDQYYSAWSAAFSGDGWELDRPASFYAQTDTIVFFDPLRPVEGYHGWETFHTAVVEAARQSGIAAADIRRTNESSIWRQDDIAWAIVPHRVTSKLGHGQFKHVDQRHTFVWQQQNEQWKIIHEHASAAVALGSQLARRHRHLPTSQAAAHFRELIQLFWNAWNTKQSDCAAQFYHSGSDLSVYLPWRTEGWIGWRAFQPAADRILQPMQKVEFKPYEDVYVLQFDNLAITAGVFEVQLHDRHGAITHGDARYTLIWEQQNGQWQILHEHLSSTLN